MIDSEKILICYFCHNSYAAQCLLESVQCKVRTTPPYNPWVDWVLFGRVKTCFTVCCMSVLCVIISLISLVLCVLWNFFVCFNTCLYICNIIFILYLSKPKNTYDNVFTLSYHCNSTIYHIGTEKLLIMWKYLINTITNFITLVVS